MHKINLGLSGICDGTRFVFRPITWKRERLELAGGTTSGKKLREFDFEYCGRRSVVFACIAAVS